MKKYILLLFSISCFAQFNPAQWYSYGKLNDTINTHIKGIGGTVNTKSLLATYLGISESRIQRFTLTGSDLDFSVTGSQKYGLAGSAGSSITFFEDNSGRVSNVGSQVFRLHTQPITRAYFPGVITQTGAALFQDSSFPRFFSLPNCTSIPTGFFGNCGISIASYLNIPKCLNIGATQGYDSGGTIRLNSNTNLLTIYANSSLQTSNGGGVEGDLADAIARGATVIWVTP